MYLPSIGFAACISVVQPTGYSPFFLVFGRQPTLPTDVLYGFKGREGQSEKHYAHETARILREAIKNAQKVQKAYDAKRKATFDKNQVDVEFKKGDLVTIFTPRTKEGLSLKLTQKNSGPFTIVKKLSPVH